jgi:AcrR family transcriptional regulator
MEESPTSRRRDAQRHRAEILEAALRELAKNPDLTIEEIARAAGVARRTFYGHFASRDALLGALLDAVANDVAAIADDIDLEEGDPPATLARFTLAAWALREHYVGLLTVTRHGTAQDALLERLGQIRSRVAALIERGQQAERFAADVPALALAYMSEALLSGAIEADNRGALPEDGGRAVTLATLRALGVPRAQADRIVTRAMS